MSVNYVHPRCIIGQWRPDEGIIAVFPGSTVPHENYVNRARERDGRGANQLMTGYYKDYRRGKHKAGHPTAHDAFRQIQGRPIRRTGDDLDYDNDDRVEVSNPYDNLHAAWSMGVNHDDYSSAGCQVVIGYPRCPQREPHPDSGPWKIFKDNAYQTDQSSFPYVLLEGRDGQSVAMGGDRKMAARLRFGSSGALVRTIQKALQKKDCYEGRIDGDFGERTIRAVLRFQEAVFGPHSDDGIIGPITAEALDLTAPWPEL